MPKHEPAGLKIGMKLKQRTGMEYRIQEVSEKLDVPPSTVRYWESVFTEVIRPARTKGGQRRYSEKEVGQFMQVKELLHVKGRTIAQTKGLLKNGNADIGQIAWEEKTILLTGGTGSFGRQLCKVMMERYHPKALRIYSRDELKQHEIRRLYGEEKVRYFIGDVRDGDRLKRAMEGADIVIHAAALKQYPFCEFNPFEAVKTNIYGAENIINAAIDAGIKKVVALSTVNAANPVNLYGTTKLCAEKIFTQGNTYSGSRGTRFSCIRCGDVMEGRDTLLARFREQRPTGKLTVSDAGMTRFWTTFDEAVGLVVSALRSMQGGEIFVPRVPSIRIMDLAEAVAPECAIEVTGIGQGEKLHEILITEEESRNTIIYNGMYVIMPGYCMGEGQSYESVRRIPGGFEYNSRSNKHWLSVDDLRGLIGGA